MQNAILICSTLELDEEDRRQLGGAFGAPIEIVPGARPVRVEHFGLDAASAVAWITLTFLGGGAALLFSSFLKSLGTELGKHAFTRLTGKARAREKEIEEERGHPVRGEGYGWPGIPDHWIALFLEHPGGIKFLIHLPSHDPEEARRLMEPLPDLIEKWLAETRPVRAEVNAIVVRRSEDGWQFELLRTGGRDETSYEFKLDSTTYLL